MVRPLTEEERAEIEKDLTSREKKDLKSMMVIDVLQWSTADLSKPLVGEVVFGSPGEMEIILDFTGLRGSGSNIYHSFIYKAPKWRYSVMKADEFLYISPVWAEYYNLTIAQKQKLESAIKAGLASAAQAVADYELVQHDKRRYQEVLDYFKTANKTGDDHVLRSMFVDRVDAYTGEGYSMVSMARRWPTIITDFIRMKTEWTDPKVIPDPEKQRNKIRQELDVSMAEATVLRTKNQLYREWKEMFLPTIKERYARIETLAKARKKSVDEYRKWLKPYIAKFRVMKEAEEDNPAKWVTDAYVTPGFGQSEALTGTRLWVFKAFPPMEKGKPEYVKGKSGFLIDPYDDWCKKWIKKIEYKYNLRITDDDVREIMREAIKKDPEKEFTLMDPNDIYYMLFDMKFLLSLLRTPPPEGVETDNLMIYPIKVWVMSHNAMLLHLIELKAKEWAIERYINEIIGASEIEEESLRRIEEEFKPEEKKRLQGWRNFKKMVSSGYRNSVRPKLMRFARLFVRPGPYEPVFFERVSKMYFRATGQAYGQIVDFFKDKMSIGK